MSRHSAILTLLIPNVITEIVKRDSLSETTAAEKFYGSKTYALLENRETGVWHYSPLCIYQIYKSECETGEPLLPEEV